MATLEHTFADDTLLSRFASFASPSSRPKRRRRRRVQHVRRKVPKAGEGRGSGHRQHSSGRGPGVRPRLPGQPGDAHQVPDPPGSAGCGELSSLDLRDAPHVTAAFVKYHSFSRLVAVVVHSNTREIEKRGRRCPVERTGQDSLCPLSTWFPCEVFQHEIKRVYV